MNIKYGVAVTVLSLMLPAGVQAQSAQPQGTTQPSTTAQTPSPASQDTSVDNHWLAFGFVGSNFANNADPASMAFGGAVGFLLKNRYGVEFDAGFTPDFDLQSNFFGLGIKPQVNTFMGNAVYAQPLGPAGRWQPFISGGVGAISLRSGLNGDMTQALGNASGPNDTRFGGNIGGGVMGFAGQWGFKADVRYYRATGAYNTTAPSNPGDPTPGDPIYTVTGSVAATNNSSASQAVAVSTDQSVSSLASAALSGLHFWRANVGVAVRW